ncbi:MAG TPA: thiamine ABC transporter substrate-binding protein [Pseudobdellovibrionaceae bacterium]|nr:thiamine ABC transporter substrate-binding protein [Pseudobdellovibrionaceae bacterium]
MVSHGLRHFVVFLFVVFFVFFFALNYQSENSDNNLHQRALRVFTLSSFSMQSGPGPRLAQIFEKDCHCRVEFIEASDSSILLQRLKIEGESLGADLVIGLNSYDISRASSEIHWKKHGLESSSLLNEVRTALVNEYFYPLSWNVYTFIANQELEVSNIQSFQDLLSLSLRKKIGIEDPRTSFRGLGLLVWISKAMGIEDMNTYLENFMPQISDIYSSTSLLEKDFLENKSKIVFSLLTSPLLKKSDTLTSMGKVLNLNQPHPVVFEFLGVPEFCENCELSQKFSNLILSEQGQRILLDQQDRLSILKGLNGEEIETKIEDLNLSKDVNFISDRKIESWLKKWTDLRRM